MNQGMKNFNNTRTQDEVCKMNNCHPNTFVYKILHE